MLENDQDKSLDDGVEMQGVQNPSNGDDFVAPSIDTIDATADKAEGIEELKNLLIYIAKGLVDSPDEVKVSSKEDGDLVLIGLSVAKEDLGKVIGKQGRTARAMRIVLGAVATKKRFRYMLEIME